MQHNKLLLMVGVHNIQPDVAKIVLILAQKWLGVRFQFKSWLQTKEFMA